MYVCTHLLDISAAYENVGFAPIPTRPTKVLSALPEHTADNRLAQMDRYVRHFAGFVS